MRSIIGIDAKCRGCRDEYWFAEDAFQVDADGKRTGFLCPRSPETYVRDGKVISYWLDDDLRLY